ncbi:MAG: DNA mismatch repair protein MutS [Candidatus Krumholzibacteriota bacterium]|nr:DNA mismatch repair protein MutS [Candidatus Krumholzibacteriota bacterium]
MSKLTPLMSQYREIKNLHPDGILFFQVGDFYETFYEDARKVSRILNITLTSRDKKNPVPLAGVPIHAGEAYIAKLLQAGEKVVICDQIEKPSETKRIVKRQVTDIITPGTALSPAILTDKENNYLISLLGVDERCGLSVMDLSTGEFQVAQDSPQNVENMLAGLKIREAIVPEDSGELASRILAGNPSCVIERIAKFHFNHQEGKEALQSHFGVNDLSCFGIEDKPLAASSAGALLEYVKNLRQNDMAHITGLRLMVSNDTLFLDAETLRNLEIFQPLRGESIQTTLIYHMDRTRTAAGARELRRWLTRPSRNISLIEGRLESISAFLSDQISLREIRQKLRGFPDIERILSRVTAAKAGPRELLALAAAVERLPGIADSCGRMGAALIHENLIPLRDTVSTKQLIDDGIEPGCPANLKAGGVIKKGYSAELDRLIDNSEEGRQWIASLQESERKRTAIPSLKVGYNKVFGYYIEVSKIHEAKVPDDYIGKQTLVSSQRYVTAAIRERENAILTANARRIELEKELFGDICGRISGESAQLQKIAKSIAVLDVLAALADLALERNYCRPEIDGSRDLIISDGRHPVVEVISEKSFIPNDISIRPEEKQVLIITGPNMGGKSTYIRQSALISIMAHMGSFVPASRARIGILDRIFTRVGSSDNLARGQSTFLVEMSETAKILHNCTSDSLVLLDEIGRGTSTADGLSIARAVTEYLLEDGGRRPKTLFATHYHELTGLSRIYPRVQNMKVDIKEWGNSIIFLYKIVEGRSDRSYGIHVAQLAGLPEKVIKRAWEIIKNLEPADINRDIPLANLSAQSSLFPEVDPLQKEIESLDPENLTPLEALRVLDKLYRMTKKR